MIGGVALILSMGAPHPGFAQIEPEPRSSEPYLGAETLSLTLEEALARFQRESLKLAASRYEVDAARADVIAAGVLPNPSIGLAGTWLLWGAATGGEREYEVSVQQAIPIGGQIGLRRGVARELATAAERDFAALAFALSYDVRLAYLDLQEAQAKYRALSAGLAQLDRAAAIIAQRAAAGANPRYDLVRIEVERGIFEARLVDAKVQLASAQQGLSVLLGRSIEPEILVAEDPIPEAPEPPSNIDSLLVRALRQRPDLSAARARILAAQLRISQTRREYVPTPEISIGYMPWYAVPDASPNRGAALHAGLTLPLPLFDRGQGQVERAAAEAKMAALHAEEAEHLIELDVRHSAIAMKARVESFRGYRARVEEHVERLLQIAETAYREGQSSILELLDAHREHLDASEREIELRAAAWRATLELDRAIGPAGPGD